MQDEIEELLRQERFSEATWNAADAAERERILQEYHDEVRKIMGTDVNPDLVFEPSPNGEVGGWYKSGQITINSDSLTAPDSYSLLTYVIHENRHAFQHEAVDNPGRHIVSNETRAIWGDSFEHGIQLKDDPQGYWEMPTEWDARGFASQNQNNMLPPYDGSWQ
jgi:hypothetical protein